MDFLGVILFLIGLGVVGFTIILDRYYRNNRLIKYIPFAFSFLIGTICLGKAYFFSKGSSDIVYVILLTFNYTFSVCSLITATIIDIARSMKTGKKRRTT